MYDHEGTVKASFDLNYISEYLLQAQWAEFVALKEVIWQTAEQKGGPISMLDIGIGNARIAKHLSGIEELWEKIEVYDGTDNAQACIDISNQNIEALGIGQKVKTFFVDALNLSAWHRTYDLVVLTWFTAGNFYPDGFVFETYSTSGFRLHLSSNPAFTRIITNCWNLLNPGGKIVIGSCYKDNEATRLKQEASYRKMEMDIITNAKDEFTATMQGFWSQRFTKERLYSYLPFIPPAQFSFRNLDTYEYAWQVVIEKH